MASTMIIVHTTIIEQSIDIEITTNPTSYGPGPIAEPTYVEINKTARKTMTPKTE
ncbi:hypothetical protein J2Z34_002907 [Youngiibacter multivorans]|uniref:Uncharacterized protein n=1 Tax=Youngiibacter multivorans TaxID=937251 RepID=A0ABS4G786_9CLOT|nr:hypothetical protein [Youngiibacter multivorans]